jgi:hypothetical protein
MAIKGKNWLRGAEFDQASKQYGDKVRRALMFGDSWFHYPVNRASTYRPDLTVQIARQFRNTLVLDEGRAGRASSHWKIALPRIRNAISSYDFDAILLSTGGNDVVGSEMGEYLKEVEEPPAPGVHPFGPVPSEVRDHVRLDCFRRALDYAITDLDVVVRHRDAFSQRTPVLLHTYDYVFPDGRRWKLGPIESGPWIAPAFKIIGLDVVNVAAHFKKAKVVTDWMLEQFAARLLAYASMRNNVRVVNSLGTLSKPSDWHNELHPTKAGFQRIAIEHWVPALTGLLK